MSRPPQHTTARDERGIEILVGDTVTYGHTNEHSAVVTELGPFKLGCPFVRVTLASGEAYYAHTLRVVEEV